jgi:hypothetical protein
MKAWHLIGGIAIAGIVAAMAVGGGTGASNAATTAPANDGQAAAEKKLADLRYYKAIVAAKRVKNAQRNPDSLKWQSVLVNEDGSLVCMVYRSQNGFGGTNVAPAVSIGDKISTDGNVWMKHCKGMKGYPLKDEVEIALEGAK